MRELRSVLFRLAALLADNNGVHRGRRWHLAWEGGRGHTRGRVTASDALTPAVWVLGKTQQAGGVFKVT